MAKYVEFPLEGGGSIFIEATEETGRGSAGFLRGEDAGAKSAQSFDSTLESIRRSADLMLSKLRGLSTAPDELAITFSLKASQELGGLMVSKGAQDTNFNVTLRWMSDKGKEEAVKEEKEIKDKKAK
ncbi:MAG: CU044_2847 family protein [Anaerolineales bacterium]